MAPNASYSLTAAILVVVLMATTTLTLACKPERKGNRTVEYKMLKSDVLAYGYPRSRTKDSSHPKHNRFVVDFEVRCIFKGAPLNEMIRIHNVGAKDPQCQVSKLTKDKPVVVYLNREGDRLVPVYREDPGSPEYLDEIPIICGAIVAYPKGYTKDNNKEECPEEYEYEEDCVRATEEPEIDQNKEAPYQPVKSADGGDEDQADGTEGQGAGGQKGQKEMETTTPVDTGTDLRPYWIVSLLAVTLCPLLSSLLL